MFVLFMWSSVRHSTMQVCKYPFYCCCIQVLLAPDSSPFTRLTPAQTTCPKPTPGEQTVDIIIVLVLSLWDSLLRRWPTILNSISPSVFQLQPDWHSSLWELRQAVRQVAHCHRGDVRLRCRVSLQRWRSSPTTRSNVVRPRWAPVHSNWGSLMDASQRGARTSQRTS